LLGNIVPSVYTPVLAKHSKNFSSVDSLAIGADRIQRNLDPLRQQVETWRSRQITDELRFRSSGRPRSSECSSTPTISRLSPTEFLGGSAGGGQSRNKTELFGRYPSAKGRGCSPRELFMGCS